jgi:hypothetical protein
MARFSWLCAACGFPSALILAACNAAPGDPTVVIEPENPTTVDDLVARIATPASDPDGDDLSYSFQWFCDVAVERDVTGDTVSADLTARGQTWRVVVVASDGDLEGPPVEAETTVLNALPEVEVSIAPEAPLTGEALVATATPFDDDDDLVTIAWSWQVDGTPTAFQEGSVPEGETERGQVWTVTVEPNDPFGKGARATASVSIDNVAPIVSSVTLEPDPAYEESEIAAVVDASDADGDPLSLDYAWYVNDSLVQEGTDGTLDGSYFDKGESVKVVVTPNDGFAGGEPFESEPIVVADTLPGAPVVTILPEDAEDADDLVCVIVTDSADADGDMVSYTFAWTRNGAAFAGATRTVWPGDTILARDTSPRDEWTCTVTPNDGTSDGPAGTDTGLVRCGDDLDGDGHIAEACGGDDCNDASRSIHPGATETVADGVDQDCSGTETCYVDADGDGYGSSSTVVSTDLDCTDTGEASAAGDCNDASASVSPGATEVCGDGVDDDCDGEDAACRYTGEFDLGSTGWKLTGEDAGDYSGQDVAGAGDVDADGYADVLVGGYLDDDGGSDAGAVYLVSGPITRDIDLSSADAKLIGENASDYCGTALGSAGDVDADGYDDLLVGAYGNDEGGSSTGAAYLVYGPLHGDLDLSAADVKIIGESTSDGAGRAVASAGDANADGYDDILVGAPYDDDGGSDAGAAYLIYGPLASDLRLSSADVKFVGEDSGDVAGFHLASAGDVDADGYVDLLLAAPNDDDGGSNAGAVYLVCGPPAGDTDLSAADAKLIGESSNDQAYVLAAAGDVDADGYDDVLVGASWNAAGGSHAGAAYLVLGPVAGDVDLSAADAKLVGETTDDWAGVSVASAGDVDADGHADLLVSAPYNGDGGTSAGEIYLVYGPISGDLDLSLADATFIGEDASDFAGSFVASAGDVDADGHADLLIGAPGDGDGGYQAGATYVILFAEMP